MRANLYRHNKPQIEKIFRRNYTNNKGERRDFTEQSMLILDLIVVLDDLYVGLMKGEYLWSTYAYNAMNKYETLFQLDFMHSKLMKMHANTDFLVEANYDVLEKKEMEKYRDLLWKNIILNDNITCEVNKIKRDYFFWDEVEKYLT